MTIKRVRQVFVSAQDFDAQAEFIEAGLGLELQFRDGDEWAQFSAGDVSLALAGPRENLGISAGLPVAVFETDDLNGLMAQVVAAGGSCGDVRDMGDHGRTVRITDPAGTCYAALEKAAP